MMIVYSEALNASIQTYSPSASKPALAFSSFSNLDPKAQVIAPRPLGLDEIAVAHCPDFVSSVFAGRKANGFGNHSESVNRSLPYTNGAMLRAAELALDNSGAAVAPVSGFHHAGWDFANAFCTFNGLVVTAMRLKQMGAVRRVGILDYDMHYGDGTAHIIRSLSLSWITHLSAGKHFNFAYQTDDFMHNITADLAKLQGCDIVLYQAGADPHIDDPLGGLLSTGQMLERDRQVFAGLKDMGIPVAWNLAGGYQTPVSKVLALHNNTYRACRKIFG